MNCCRVAAGMLSIGSLVGCLLAGLCMERLGRRITLLVVTSAAYTAGFLAILLAPSAPVIYLGRCRTSATLVNIFIMMHGHQ